MEVLQVFICQVAAVSKPAVIPIPVKPPVKNNAHSAQEILCLDNGSIMFLAESWRG